MEYKLESAILCKYFQDKQGLEVGKFVFRNGFVHVVTVFGANRHFKVETNLQRNEDNSLKSEYDFDLFAFHIGTGYKITEVH